MLGFGSWFASYVLYLMSGEITDKTAGTHNYLSLIQLSVNCTLWSL